MRLLAAAHGTRLDDFEWTVPGELVYLGAVCDRDRNAERDQGCGCARAFAGLTSAKSTTLATVVDLELTYDDLTAVVHNALTGQGWPADDVPATVEDMIVSGEAFDIGAPVRRWLNDLYITATP